MNFNENRFKMLQDLNDGDDDTYGESDHGDVKEYKVVIPPIVVDPCHGFIQVFKLIGKEYEFKRISVRTKIISSSMVNYDTAKNKLSAAKILNSIPMNVRTPKYLNYFYTDFPNWTPKKLKMN